MWSVCIQLHLQFCRSHPLQTSDFGLISFLKGFCRILDSIQNPYIKLPFQVSRWLQSCHHLGFFGLFFLIGRFSEPMFVLAVQSAYYFKLLHQDGPLIWNLIYWNGFLNCQPLDCKYNILLFSGKVVQLVWLDTSLTFTYFQNLHCCNINSGQSFPISIKFNSTDYTYLSYLIKILPRGKSYGKWSLADSQKPTPDKAKESEEWDTNNVFIVTWIAHSVEPSIGANLSKFVEAKAVWDYLARVYVQSNFGHRYQLATQYPSIYRYTSQISSSYFLLSSWEQT